MSLTSASADSAESAESAASPPSSVDVLVVGAGPTGLTAALEACRLGMSVRIIERHPSRIHRSKALVVHARTMEMFESLGLADALRERGAVFRALNLHGWAGATGRIDLDALAWGDTDYPYWLTLPQYETEQVLEQALADCGVNVEWGTSFTGLAQSDDDVVADLQRDDAAFDIRSHWLVGADGGRSRVRDSIGGRMERDDADATFVLADAFTMCDLTQDEGHFYLHPDGMLVIVPLPIPNQWRIIAHVPGVAASDQTPIDAAMLDELIQRRASVRFGAHDVGWTSRFALSHGVADLTRRGRVFLVGDAAHVHSPVGGQGLNTGVQDAHGLMWRLAVAGTLEPEHREALLAGFVAERGRLADGMVRAVQRATSLVAGRSSLSRRIVGLLAPRILPRTSRREILARPVASLQTRYQQGAAVASGGGARPANGPAVGGGSILSRLAFGEWTWIVRGDDDAGCRGLPVVRTQEAGAARIELVRPDGYVAAAGEDCAAVWRSVRHEPVLAAMVGAVHAR